MTELDTNQHRYSSLRKILERPGPFCHPDFEPSPDILTFLQESCRVLVVGAGGLGCELLKNLALLGFRDIHVVDMDTIELSNLNRQFLFRHSDIGSSKAATAAKFINGRVPGCRVTPHHCRMQELDDAFYRDFHLVACGLDSVMGRRWINGMLISLLKYDDDGTLDPSSVVPLVDGGAEGFKGSARVILPGCNACIECTLALFPPQVAYPLCTLASTPRLPEHCVEYVKLLQWPRDKPFPGPLDADDPAHIAWIHEKAVERAAQFSIPGVTYRLVQGVVKNIIPAVASTNAVVAAAVSTECFKLATSCYAPLDNYMVFSDLNGVYTYSYEAERRPDCLACSQVAKSVPASSSQTLKQLIAWLTDSPDLQMRSPGLTTVVNGRNKTLYMSGVPSIEAATRANLDKTLGDLGLVDGTELLVADVTSPATLVLRLKIDEVEAI